MKLVVGLGNPGPKYQNTRHNVGFDAVHLLAHKFSALAPKPQFDSLLTEIVIAGERILLATPKTFMNLSGRSVRQYVTFFKLPLTDLLLICDDMNLACGKVRLRASGTAGGQKGLQNTIDQLGTTEFPRLRIGIGRPPENWDTVDFVLGRLTAGERETIDQALELTAKAIECWVKEGLTPAMNLANASPPPKK